jgi:hypothetical protein
MVWFAIVVDVGVTGEFWTRCWCKMPRPWYSVMRSVGRYCRVTTMELECWSMGCRCRVGA